MQKIRNAIPSMVLMALLIGLWWWVVLATESLIFPTPGQVVAGTLELAADGTLWEHIGASLFRVGCGFALIENLYVLWNAPDAGLATWVVRGFGTAIMHGGATAIVAVIGMIRVSKIENMSARRPGNEKRDKA